MGLNAMPSLYILHLFFTSLRFYIFASLFASLNISVKAFFNVDLFLDAVYVSFLDFHILYKKYKELLIC